MKCYNIPLKRITEDGRKRNLRYEATMCIRLCVRANVYAHLLMCRVFLCTNEREKSIELTRAIFSVFGLDMRSNANARTMEQENKIKRPAGHHSIETIYISRRKNYFLPTCMKVNQQTTNHIN